MKYTLNDLTATFVTANCYKQLLSNMAGQTPKSGHAIYRNRSFLHSQLPNPPWGHCSCWIQHGLNII